MRAQRADFYENNVGRFISIEANTTQASVTCTNPSTGSGCPYTGPVLQAAAYDANNKPIASGALRTYLDPDPSAAPDYYQYHYEIFRIGNKGDGGPDPAYVKISAPNGDVDTISAKEWLPKNPPGYAQTFQHDFNTRYYTAQEGYARVHDLAAQYPNIAKELKAPEQTWGYMRRAATMVGYQQASYVTFAPLVDPQTGLSYQAPNGSTSTLSTANAAKTVVLRTKAWGHEGGNDYSAQLVNSERQQRAAHRLADRQEAHGQPGHQRHRRDHQHRGPGHRGRQRLRGLSGHRGSKYRTAPPTASSCRATSRRSATC